MALLSDDQAQQLAQMFSGLSADVTLVHDTQKPSKLVVPGALQCPSCQDTLQLLEELAGISTRLTLETHDFVAEAEAAAGAGIDKIPATVIDGVHSDGRVRYFGLPAGYEFVGFIEDIIDVGSGGPALEQATADALTALASPVHIQVFVSPTCPYCPAAVRAAHKLAMASAKVSADCVVVGEFPHLAQRYGVMAVPRTVINETVSFDGPLSEDRLVEQIAAAVAD